jgi:hypothetical protein
MNTLKQILCSAAPPATILVRMPVGSVFFSVGRSLDGRTRFQAYVAYQLTFGPRK